MRIEVFMNKKEAEIIKAKFKAKLQIIWEISALGDFNSCCMTIKAKLIIVMQKNQAKKLVFVDIKNNAKK